jgi:hypothetical protein
MTVSEGQFCGEFGKQFQALTGRIDEVEEAIEAFISSGKPSDIEKARELFSSFKEEREEMMRQYREKAKSLLNEWFQKNTSRILKQQKKFDSQIRFDQDGRVVFDGDLAVNNLYSYFPSLIKKVKGSLWLSRIENIDYLEEIEGRLEIYALGSFLAKRLRRVKGSLYFDRAQEINLPSLESTGGTQAEQTTSFTAEKLRKVRGDLKLSLEPISKPNFVLLSSRPSVERVEGSFTLQAWIV